MNSNDLLARRTQEIKVAWFDFLLNPSLLDEHLSNEHAEPNATQLIAHFLTNCSPELGHTDTVWPVTSDVEALQPNNQTSITDDSATVSDTRKLQALKLLALQVFSFLNWDLNIIEKKLPLHMQFIILTDLKALLAPENVEPSTNHWKDMSLDFRFACILMHQWTIRTVITGSYPVRQSRGLSVQIPGQTDQMVTPADVADNIMKTVFEQYEKSTNALRELLKLNLECRMPTAKCLGLMSESVLVPNHQWEKGIIINKNELVCQVSYDVGCSLFFQKQFPEAKRYFKVSSELYAGLKNPIFCTFPVDKLNGYCIACSNIVDPFSNNSPNQLLSRIKVEVANNTQEAIHILLNDNINKELTLNFRDNLEWNILQNPNTNPDFCAKVVLCNVLRYIIEGKTVVKDLTQFLKPPSLQDFFCKAICAVLKALTPFQQKCLRSFLLLQVSAFKELHGKCQDAGIIEALFSIEEEKRLSVIQDKCIVGVPRDLSFTDSTVTKMSHLERELISTRTPDSVETVLNQLTDLKGSSSFIMLNSSWELPRPIIMLIRNMPPDINQELVYILLAKAAELRTAHCYQEARQMFKRVEEEAGNISANFDTALRLELIHTDVLQFVNEPVYSEQMKENVLKQAKTCIVAYMDGRDFIPKPEIVELSIHILLNCKEWEFFSGIPTRKGDLLEFPKLLALMCREISAGRNSNRSVNTDFWDLIAQVFLPACGQYKRTGSGASREMIRESSNAYYNRVTLRRLVKGIKDNLALSIILGAVVRLQNILKDDKDLDIYLEHPSLWPSVLGNANHFNMPSVGQFLQEVLHHCLSVHPTSAPLLKTHGDVVYVQDQFTAALKSYLSAAMVSSENFSLPLPKQLFDDTQLKRMIQCCCKLQCHTQAAILTQFLEESNYTLAFKELSERSCSDSCDSYFVHIWDMTLLEFLVNLYARRGEIDRQLLVMRLMGQLELNANNNEEIQREAASVRKASFLRALAKQYM